MYSNAPVQAYADDYKTTQIPAVNYYTSPNQNQQSKHQLQFYNPIPKKYPQVGYILNGGQNKFPIIIDNAPKMDSICFRRQSNQNNYSFQSNQDHSQRQTCQNKCKKIFIVVVVGMIILGFFSIIYFKNKNKKNKNKQHHYHNLFVQQQEKLLTVQNVQNVQYLQNIQNLQSNRDNIHDSWKQQKVVRSKQQINTPFSQKMFYHKNFDLNNQQQQHHSLLRSFSHQTN